MVIVVIRTQLRADADVAHDERVGARMDALVRAMPGFVSAKDFAAADGDCGTARCASGRCAAP